MTITMQYRELMGLLQRAAEFVNAPSPEELKYKCP